MSSGFVVLEQRASRTDEMERNMRNALLMAATLGTGMILAVPGHAADVLMMTDSQLDRVAAAGVAAVASGDASSTGAYLAGASTGTSTLTNSNPGVAYGVASGVGAAVGAGGSPSADAGSGADVDVGGSQIWQHGIDHSHTHQSKYGDWTYSYSVDVAVGADN